jgi:pimeloyl-ACP methyl ester carboxylesterase
MSSITTNQGIDHIMNAVPVGHSMGGAASLAIAIQRPELAWNISRKQDILLCWMNRRDL